MQALVEPVADVSAAFAPGSAVALGDAASAAVADEDIGAASGSGVVTAGLALGKVEVAGGVPAVAALAVAGALGVTAAHATIAEKPARSTDKAGGGRIMIPAYHMGHDARELCVAHVSHLGRVR